MDPTTFNVITGLASVCSLLIGFWQLREHARVAAILLLLGFVLITVLVLQIDWVRPRDSLKCEDVTRKKNPKPIRGLPSETEDIKNPSQSLATLKQSDENLSRLEAELNLISPTAVRLLSCWQELSGKYPPGVYLSGELQEAMDAIPGLLTLSTQALHKRDLGALTTVIEKLRRYNHVLHNPNSEEGPC